MKTMLFQWEKSKKASSRSVSAVAVINILLAVLALLKDIFVASYLGTSDSADAFSLAFFLPDMIGNNLVAVAIGMNCIPLFSRLIQRKNFSSLFRAFFLVNLLTAVLSAALTLALWGLRTPVISLLGNGLSEATKDTCVRLLSLMVPTVLLYPAAAIGSSLLQARGRFVISSLSPVLFNAVFFLATACCYFQKVPVGEGVYLVSASVLAAEIAVTLYTYFFVALDRTGIHPLPPEQAGAKLFPSEQLRESLLVLRSSSGYLLILLLSQAALYVERYLSTGFGAGGVAALNYAYRISQFPIWVFAAAVSTVAFPEMSKAVESAPERAKEITGNCLSAVFLLNLPILAAFVILRVPITSFLFERGNFNAESVRMTAGILTGYALAIPGQSICSILLRLIVAAKKIRQAVVLYLLGMAVNVAADFLFTRIWGLSGIGYGTALASLLCAGGMIVLSDSADVLKSLYRALAKIAAACLAVAAVCLLLNWAWNSAVAGGAFVVKCVFVLSGAILCTSAYAAMLRILKIFK